VSESQVEIHSTRDITTDCDAMHALYSGTLPIELPVLPRAHSSVVKFRARGFVVASRVLVQDDTADQKDVRLQMAN